MLAFRSAIFLAVAAIGSAAPARTVVIFVEPMTLEKRAEVIDNKPGPDRFLMCMQPPSLSGCREVTAQKRR